jgi:nitrogen fixation NifU-like protein
MLTAELRELYQEMILDHQADPRNFREMAEPTRVIDGQNPLCGDRMRVYVKLRDDTIVDVSFRGAGCAISTASASMMTELLRGRRVDQAEPLIQQFVDMVQGKAEASQELGSLKVLAGVREFPARVKCATLAWRALEAALHAESDAVTTES